MSTKKKVREKIKRRREAMNDEKIIETVKAESEEKKEEQSQKEVLEKFVITVRTDGTVDITGPIMNFMLFRQAMCQAENAVLDMHARLLEEKQNKRIIEPGGPSIVPGKVGFAGNQFGKFKH